MSGVHCQRFPDCMELAGGIEMPRCAKPDCPGNAARIRAINFATALFQAPTCDTARRPKGSNADEWHLFLAENRDALPYVAVQIAEAIDEAAAEVGALRHERDLARAELARQIDRR